MTVGFQKLNWYKVMSTTSPSQSSTDTASVNVPCVPALLKDQPKNKVTYLSQIIVIYTIIATAIIHLSLQSPDKELWLVLLSSSLGYILPTPSLKLIKTTSNSP